MAALINLLARLRAVIKHIIKRFSIFAILSLVALLLLMMTPFWSKVLLYGLNKLPVEVVTENSLLKTQPKFIVVLGGGLSRNANNDIQPNHFTQKRLKTAQTLYQANPLPFMLSGVESPWMKDWLVSSDAQTQRIKTETKSLNTCENVNFTTIKLKNHGVNHIYLVTDAYHMARARRLFAKKGVFTLPVSAPLTGQTILTWDTPRNNFHHSRRATYELIAVARDSLLSSGLPSRCRKTPPFADNKKDNIPKMSDELF